MMCLPWAGSTVSIAVVHAISAEHIRIIRSYFWKTDRENFSKVVVQVLSAEAHPVSCSAVLTSSQDTKEDCLRIRIWALLSSGD